MDHFRSDFLQLPARTVIITRMKSVTTFRDLSEFQTCEHSVTSTFVKMPKFCRIPFEVSILRPEKFLRVL